MTRSFTSVSACIGEPRIGKPHPLGASFVDGGVNFSVYAKDATSVTLHLFAHEDDCEPLLSFVFDPIKHCQSGYWFLRLQNINHGQLYVFEVDGPWLPEQGLRFDKEKMLLDPYCHGIARSRHYQRHRAMNTGSNIDACLKSVVINHETFDWQGIASPKHSLNDTVIYEMHVKGFTQHPSSEVERDKRGTFLGIIEKIPYLKSLGITAVELMPIQQFDKDDAPSGQKNYWGYSPINFFAVHADYSVSRDPLSAIIEFKTLVRELHRAGIEVILDVVFNHTAEGDENGPTFSFKGLQNDTYYLLNKDGEYANYSGCGNTCNANASVLRRMIIDALHYWVTEMHVDGFRFDLASVLSRDSEGHPMKEPPLLWSIDSDPILSGTKIIAEAWDAAGLYQVGDFFGDRWNEWNGKYRDDVRAFWRGDNDTVGDFASRLLGSPDIYGHADHAPHRSVNFVCAHDGFTLNDVVSYQEKHNFANGESNRDGDNHNISANYGVEGKTDCPDILNVRSRQCKNMITTLFLSLGTPMILMGDEVRRTQKGNNNTYCQDNPSNWFDWRLVDENADLLRFVSLLTKLRRGSPAMEWHLHQSLNDVIDNVGVQWHGIEPDAPDWSVHSHSIALTAHHPMTKEKLYIICNAYWDPLRFTLPDCPNHDWHRLIDTALPSPNDIIDIDETQKHSSSTILVAGRSMVIMIAKT